MEETERNLGFLLNDVARLLRREFNRKAEDLGLSQAQWRALAYLSRCEGVNQVTLAESLEVQPMTLVRLIDHLERRGLVERRADPADRRAFRLYLTEDAQPLLQAMRKLGNATRERALEGLPEEKRAALISALLHMKVQLTEAADDAAQVTAQTEGVRIDAAGKR